MTGAETGVFVDVLCLVTLVEVNRKEYTKYLLAHLAVFHSCFHWSPPTRFRRILRDTNHQHHSFSTSFGCFRYWRVVLKEHNKQQK